MIGKAKLSGRNLDLVDVYRRRARIARGTRQPRRQAQPAGGITRDTERRSVQVRRGKRHGAVGGRDDEIPGRQLRDRQDLRTGRRVQDTQTADFDVAASLPGAQSGDGPQTRFGAADRYDRLVVPIDQSEVRQRQKQAERVYVDVPYAKLKAGLRRNRVLDPVFDRVRRK